MAIPLRVLPLTVTIVKPRTVTDRYGTTVLDWANADRITVRGALSAPKRGGSSEVDVGRTQMVMASSLYLLPDAPLEGIDHVEVDGRTYQVDGPPEVAWRRGQPHHLVAMVKHVEG